MKIESYIQLKQALENKNYEDAFRGAHTLKGVCQNLSFDRLYEVSNDLTELLRDRTGEQPGIPEAMKKVTEVYEMTIEEIKEGNVALSDAKFNRDILKEILGDAYNYLEAENGNQAIQMIGENIGIDLMLLDINMPQMNGFEVLKIMKRSQCIAETPVIMISSEDAVDTMRKAYELGITDYITRPFDSVIVKKRVQNTLGLYMNQKHLINVVYDRVYEKEENNNIMIRIMSNILGSCNSESREHILHIKTATEMMLRQLVKVTDAYPLTEADIALITTASSLHDIGKIRIPEE